MGVIARFLGWAWRRWGDYQSVVAILDLLDLKTSIFGALGFIAMMFVGATNTDWSAPGVVIAALVAGACVAIIAVAVRLALGTASVNRTVSAKSKTNPLRIILGGDGDFETKSANGLYMITHTFKVAIRNETPNGFLSNCKLFLSIANANGGPLRSYLLVDTFTLNASEERYVPIVSYDEPATVSRHAGNHIRLHIPTGAAWFAEAVIGWPMRIPVGSYVFGLRAISKETGPSEIMCKIYIDSEEKLHFEKA